MPALLDHRDVADRPDRVDDVVVAEHLALPAVERLDALELVRPFAEVGDARARDAAAAADDEGALEIAPARGVVDAQQPGAHVARAAPATTAGRAGPRRRGRARAPPRRAVAASDGRSSTARRTQRDAESTVALRRKADGTPSAELPANCLCATR